jgi:hypothetical protein
VKILFVMASPEYLRYYDSTIRLLASRGHQVTIGVNHQREKKPVGLEGLGVLAEHVAILGVIPKRTSFWRPVGRRLRGLTDFVRYLHPRFADSPALRARIKRKVLHPAFRGLDRIASLPPPIHRAAIALLGAFERAIPSSGTLERFLRTHAPDVVLVSPLVDAASDQVDLVKSAKALGIPVGACIASWDNLTNKGLLRLEPDLVLVWNEIQKAEAIELHGVRPQRVAVTGAQLFDRWFDRRATRDREAFCTRVGLPPGLPFALFTGSSSFISETHAEVAFVRQWITAIRSSGVDVLQELAVLVRPHPYNAGGWATADLSDLGRVAIFPRSGYSPIDEENRNDYFDSLFHAAAVVGINTSAMLEAAILRRPVLSIVASEFSRTQQGTLHFHYLLPENGGFVRLSRSLPEHVAQLADALRNPAAVEAHTTRFLRAFIRPHGLETPCTPVMADVIERLAKTPSRRERQPLWALALMPILFAIGGGVGAATVVLSPEARSSFRKRFRGARARARKKVQAFVRLRPSVSSVTKRLSLRRVLERPGRQLVRVLRRARHSAAMFVRYRE